MIQSSLGVGKIHIHGKDSIQLRVDSLKELQIITNHFETYPLVTAKLADYILFKKALDIILLKEHLSQKGLLKLVGIKASLHLGLNDALKEAFPNWKEIQVNRPDYVFKAIPDPNWMAGFASGDSSFNVKISDSPTSLLTKRVQIRFAIGPWGVGYLYKGPIKLPNSGDPLELQVPSHNRKVIGGWTNHSCMVTILETSEKKVGNRGSKSDLSVKEQRVDGSWLSSDALGLRYTLWSFKRNSLIKFPSNQINKVRWYTSITHAPTSVKSKLSPWFVTGFADAECSFSILIQANSRYATGWRIKPVFA